MKAGDRVRFPNRTVPWQSMVLRHRTLSIKAGAEGVLDGDRFASNRGEVADVVLPPEAVLFRGMEVVGRTCRLLVKTSEMEPAEG